MKKIIALLAAILLSQVAGAELFTDGNTTINHTLMNTSVTIYLQENGVVHVNEKFLFELGNQNDYINFEKLAEKTGSNTISWKNFNQGIDFFVAGDRQNLSNRTSPYVENNQLIRNAVMLTIEYDAIIPSIVTGQTNRVKYMKFDESKLNIKTKSGSFIIPKNFVMSVVIPEGSQLLKNIKPESYIITENAVTPSGGTSTKVTWSGHITTSEINLEYTWEIPITEEVTQIQDQIFDFLEKRALILAGVLAIMLLFVVFSRKKIRETLEKYVEEHNTGKEEKNMENEDLGLDITDDA